jgi:hypothetical protein
MCHDLDRKRRKSEVVPVLLLDEARERLIERLKRIVAETIWIGVILHGAMAAGELNG